jgi:hypothetical protein
MVTAHIFLLLGIGMYGASPLFFYYNFFPLSDFLFLIH